MIRNLSNRLSVQCWLFRREWKYYLIAAALAAVLGWVLAATFRCDGPGDGNRAVFVGSDSEGTSYYLGGTP